MSDREPPHPGGSPKPAPTREDLAARLAAVQEREAAAQQEQERRRGKATGIGLGMRIGIELVVSVLVGAGLGWYIDQKLHTKPIFLLAMVSLGFTAGVLNSYRIAKGLDDGIGRTRRNTPPPPSGSDDDDD